VEDAMRQGEAMKTHDPNGTINPDFVRASSRADDLVSDALMEIRRGNWLIARERLRDAARWLDELAKVEAEQIRKLFP
jgi:predicted metal-dependent hydrolase